MPLVLKKQITVILTLLVLFAIPALGATNETIKLAVVGVHSGDMAEYGLSTVRAARFVVADYNLEGGINGSQVEMVVKDDKCDVGVAMGIAIDLVHDGVDAVLGHTCPAVTKAVLPIYKDAGVVVISPSDVSFRSTHSNKYPNYFRIIPHAMVQAKIVTTFAINNIGVQKIAVLFDKSEYGVGIANLVRDNVIESQRAQVVLFGEVITGSGDYGDIVQDIKQKKADIVFFSGDYKDASKIVSTMRKNHIETLFITDDRVNGESFIQSAGALAEGVYVTARAKNSENVLTVSAIEKYRKKFGEDPGPFYLSGYAAAMAVLNTIEKAGTSNLNVVVKTMRAQKMDTPIGQISFDEHGDVVGVEYDLYQVQNGQFIEVSH